MAKEIEVQLLGNPYVFNVPETITADEFVLIADYVENKYKRIRREVGDLDSFKLGLLASINVAEEYYSLKKEYEKMRRALERIDSLIPPLNAEGQISIHFSS